MPRGRARRGAHGNGLDAWPGYVDALSTLLMVIIFVMLIFALAQGFLSVALSGRDRALADVRQQLSEMSDMLSLQRARADAAETGLGVARRAAEDARAEVAQTNTARDDLLTQLRAAAARAEHAEAQNEGEDAAVAALSAEVAELRAQLTGIAQALDLSRADAASRATQVQELGARLNAALADKVAELQRYRSEFFGRLRDVLANRPGIEVVGDRFVFQSEVLFPAGSADVTAAGQAQIAAVAASVVQVAAEIPAGIPWMLRVDGHADRQPLTGHRYATNWELSAARAIAVGKLLIADGVPAAHIAATGFADFQPLDPGTTQDAYARNRRIELRLTDR